jgi:L-ascorbate metabolism protein UlaG (beta-lactamase superfamily)
LPRSFNADIAVLSHQDYKRFALDAFETKPFLVADPGEYEVKGVFMFGETIPHEGDKTTHPLAYRFNIEGMNIGFLGSLSRALTEAEAGKLENIDILLLPVGGGDKIAAKQAIEIINMVEPRLVVPLEHHVEGVKASLTTADAFCRELGVCKRQDANKLKLSKKDLPAEEMVITVLERA